MGMANSRWGAALGGGMQAGAQRSQQNAENASLKWNAAVAKRDAELAENKAQRAEQAAEQEAKETRLTYNALRAEQRAGYAAGSVDVNYGGAADVQAKTVAWGEYEAQKAIYNGSLEAFRYRTEGFNKQMEAETMLAQRQKPNMAAAIIGGINSYGQVAWSRG